MIKDNFFSNTYINRNIFLFKKENENQNELKFIRIKIIYKIIFLFIDIAFYFKKLSDQVFF
jgi:hypothetical protein